MKIAISRHTMKRAAEDKTMPRMKKTKRAELAAFWHAHLEVWAASSLNQGEYCRLMGCR